MAFQSPLVGSRPRCLHWCADFCHIRHMLTCTQRLFTKLRVGGRWSMMSRPWRTRRPNEVSKMCASPRQPSTKISITPARALHRLSSMAWLVDPRRAEGQLDAKILSEAPAAKRRRLPGKCVSKVQFRIGFGFNKVGYTYCTHIQLVAVGGSMQTLAISQTVWLFACVCV